MRKQASIQDCFGSHSPLLLLPSVMNISFSLWRSEAGLSKLVSILLHFNECLYINIEGRRNWFSGTSSFTGHLQRWWNTNDLLPPWMTLNLWFCFAMCARMSCTKSTMWNKQRLGGSVGRADWVVTCSCHSPPASAAFTPGKTVLGPLHPALNWGSACPSRGTSEVPCLPGPLFSTRLCRVQLWQRVPKREVFRAAC